VAVRDLISLLPASVRDRVAAILNGRERLIALAGGAVAAVLVAVAVAASRDSGYSVLYAGLSPEEGGRAIAELQKLNVAYRTAEDGRLILVPKDELGTARLQLALRGIPKQDGDHWSLLDNQSLGISPFVEQVHYLRALESSLSQTIRGVDGVISATVKLALPKQTDLLGDAPKPSASVIVRLRPGLQLTASQVEGIEGLVAASVPGLKRDSVTIVDQTGRMLGRPGKDSVEQVPQQLGIARDIARRYEAMITDLLVPALGRENFRVSVDVDLDFSRAKEGSVTYGSGHLLSQDETIQNRSAAEVPIGIPGALSNRPPNTPTTATTPAAPETPKAAEKSESAPPSDTHKITNYNVDRNIQYIERPSWKLHTINVAVLVNATADRPLPADRVTSVKALVGTAIGAGQNRNVAVVELPFQEPATIADGGGWNKDRWMLIAEQNAVLAAAGLLLLLAGLRPLLRRVDANLVGVNQRAGQAGNLLSFGRNAAPAAANERTEADVPAGTARGPRLAPSPDPETVRTLVLNEPDRAAQVIKEWIASDRNRLKQAS
jgi:flagellar M-ring protein FliF